MDKSQLEAYNACVYGDKSVFCTGGAGCGKSFVLSNVVKRLRAKYNTYPGAVVVTASTGSAAFLIHGITLHRFAGVGIEEYNLELMIGKAKSKINARNWRRVKILIIDEISMISSTLLDNLSLVAQRIRANNEPFGGIRLLLFRDFLQLPPISFLGFRGHISRAFESTVWADLNMKVIDLKGHNRYGNNFVLADVLSRLRKGSHNVEDTNYIKNLVRTVTYEDSIEPVRLYARKDKVSRYNSYRLSQLKTECVVLESTDIGTESLLSQCPVEKNLQLKIGAQVMLVRNINNVLVNGSVGTLVEFEKGEKGNMIPIVNIVTRNSRIIRYKADPVEWSAENALGNVAAIRNQVPLILAWAITIHKSQGRTIPRVIVDMEGVFEEGQCYVALSRCPDDSKMQVLNFKESYIMTNAKCVEFYASMSDNNPATGVATYTE